MWGLDIKARWPFLTFKNPTIFNPRNYNCQLQFPLDFLKKVDCQKARACLSDILRCFFFKIKDLTFSCATSKNLFAYLEKHPEYV